MMKIVYLAAGAGNMYCGSCLQGNTLAAALRAAGQDCLLVPMYTPLRTDEEGVGIPRVAFGGINVYLQQHWAAFRHTPAFLDRLLNRPALLRWAVGRSSSVRPEHLGALTVSMLEGEQGRQRKELEKLLRWLEREVRPRVIHLNNVLLIGVAREIIRRLGVHVVCSLGGEDSFVERLPEPYRGRAVELLRQRAAEVTLLVAMNRYYAGFMAAYLRLPPERIRVIPPGLNLAGYAVRGKSSLTFVVPPLGGMRPEDRLKAELRTARSCPRATPPRSHDRLSGPRLPRQGPRPACRGAGRAGG